MIEMQYQNSPERQFLYDIPLQYIVQLMKHRDYEHREEMVFDSNYQAPQPTRRANGVKAPITWSPNYAHKRHKQIYSRPITATETQRRIYAAGASNTDVWSHLKRINGKNFQLFWCIEDYRDSDYRGLDAHAALFIAGLHTTTLIDKYSVDATLRQAFGDDYAIKNIIAQCIRDAGLSVSHTVISTELHPDKYSSQIHAVQQLKVAGTPGTASLDAIKIHYLTKSINDASGSMCFGSNQKLEHKYVAFLQRSHHDNTYTAHQACSNTAEVHNS